MSWKEAKKWSKEKDPEYENKYKCTVCGDVILHIKAEPPICHDRIMESMSRDWRDVWKYGQIVRGLGCKGNYINFDWGPKATTEQKNLLKECIDNPSKWAAKVEAILDDPPTANERKLFKKMKKIKLFG